MGSTDASPAAAPAPLATPSRGFVKWGLQFGDAEVEREFCSTAMYSPLNLAVAWWIMLIFSIINVGEYVFDLGWYYAPPQATVPYNNAAFAIAGTIGTLLLVGWILFSLSADPCLCRKRGREQTSCTKQEAQPRIARAATLFTVVGFSLFFPRHFVLQQFYAIMLSYNFMTSIVGSVGALANGTANFDDWDFICSTLNLGMSNSSNTTFLSETNHAAAMDLEFDLGSVTSANINTHPFPGWPESGAKASFGELSRAARVIGLMSSGVADGLVEILVIWVGLKILVVNNLLPAREFVILVPVSGLLLILLVGDMLTASSFANLNFSTSDAALCVPDVFDLRISAIFEYAIAIIGACLALVQQVVIRSRMRREMFYWTKKLHVKMADLEREVNPFQLTTLRQWLENSSKSPIDLPSMEVDGEGIENGNDNAEGCHDPSSAETTLSLTASAEFWAVPTPDLRLVSKVAAGAGGTVWKASYRGKIVAAKQLFALQTPSQREEGLKELAHEVAILGQLDHPSIVRFLGLWRQGQQNDDRADDAFIVQEWCAGNLRMALDSGTPQRNSIGGRWRVNSNADELSSRRTFLSLLQQRLIYAYQLAEGMRYLHGRGIVHRDLKPENVLLSVGRIPHVRICDFGISSDQRQSVSFTPRPNGATTLDKHTNHNPPVHEPSRANEEAVTLPPEPAAGTLEYMAPEIFACYATGADCRGRFSPSIDVYAFGVIVWELLQGPSEYRASTSTTGPTQHANGVWSSHDFTASRSLPSRTNAATSSVQQTSKARTVVGMASSRHHADRMEPQAVSRGADDILPLPAGSGDGSNANSAVDVVSNLELLRQVRYPRAPNRNSWSPPAPLSLIQISATWSIPDLDVLPQTCPAPLKRLVHACWTLDATRRPDFNSAVDVLSGIVGTSSGASRSRRTTATVVELQSTPYRGDGLNEDRLLDLGEPLARDMSATSSQLVTQGVEDDANVPFSEAIESTSLSLWGKMWHRCGLHFGSNAAEQLFVLRRLHSDEYYRPTRWSLLMLSTLNFVHGAMVLIVVAVQMHNGVIIEFGDIVLNVAVPLLKTVLFMWCAAAGWAPQLRSWASNVALPLVVALALFEFLVVPVANFTHREFVTDIEAMSTHNNATIAYPPLNSTFENGLLIGPNGIPGDQIPDGRTVCAGTVVQAMTGYHVTSACQSILFQVGVGTLYFLNTWGFGLLTGLTMPVIFLFLAFPVRMYLCALIIPMLGSFVTVYGLLKDYWYLSEVLQSMAEVNPHMNYSQDNLSRLEVAVTDSFVYFALIFGIYASCIGSALAHERYHRNLFTVHAVRREILQCWPCAFVTSNWASFSPRSDRCL
eukprot:INCI3153.2.p1 GENE.INCI3153.2~~INCI3153.2.p1  ORF type:complete len:1335 (-),score=150.16 INCI3153.2:1269-5273(-)